MKIAIISFTKKGNSVSLEIRSYLEENKNQVTTDTKCRRLKRSEGMPEISLGEWTKEKIATEDAIIYVGAVGIAVRAIAPYVQHKTKDPAVLVVDELARYCIPLLSGHIGGANELAEKICEGLACGTVPVITTATDLNHKWAVDVFAKKNHLVISDMKRAKEISARILAGEKIRIYLEEPGRIYVDQRNLSKELQIDSGRLSGELQMDLGNLPEELQIVSDPEKADIYIGAKLPEQTEAYRAGKLPVQAETQAENLLRLIPKCMTLGLGCKKGTAFEKIEDAVRQVFETEHLDIRGLRQVASIDLKAEEKGILEFCKKHALDYQVYSAEQLKEVPGNYQASEFVSQITGVDNVCERSAVCAELDREKKMPAVLVKKTPLDGVTVAVTVGDWSVSFE